MARPKIEEIEKIKRAAIELNDAQFAELCDWLLLLAEVRQAEAKRLNRDFKAQEGAGK